MTRLRAWFLNQKDLTRMLHETQRSNLILSGRLRQLRARVDELNAQIKEGK